MGKITLQREVLGPGYKGTIDVPAGLSWMDSAAIQQTATAAWETSIETRRAREALDRLSYDVGDVADSIDRFESSIGLRLDTQTQVLERQTQALEEIRDAVLNPAKTRAAERIGDATQLLQNERYERALKVAEEAIDADPNNPSGFFAAGWALVASERFDDARAMFEEARDASSGDQRSLGCRQAARSAFLAGKREVAYELCRDARAVAKGGDEIAAVNYDIAVYAWATGDRETAVTSIEEACKSDSRHAERAIHDPALEQATPVRDAAAGTLRLLAEEIEARRPKVDGSVSSLRESLPDPPTNHTRKHVELDAGVRPGYDWSLLRDTIERQLESVEGTISDAEKDARLQIMIEALADVEEQLSDTETTLLPWLRAAIEEHDLAVANQDRLANELQEASARQRRWNSIAGQRTWVAKRRGWLIAGVALTLLGLLIGPLLIVGLLILLTLGSLYAIGLYAAQRRDAETETVNDLERQLGRRRTS